MSRRIKSPLITLLILILIVFPGYLYVRSVSLEERISDLEYQNQVLVGRNKALQKQVENVTSENEILHRLYNGLLAEYEDLNKSYHNLMSEFNLTRIIILEDHAYLSIVKSLILKANKSIYVAIYVIKYDVKEPNDPVNQLLNALVDARKRGLDVKVLVDDPTLRSYPDTISYLKNNSVEIKLDEKKGVTSHMKIVIIDDTYLVVGSHNWTESALSYNHEYSVLIVSRYHAEAAEKYFLNLWNSGRIL